MANKYLRLLRRFISSCWLHLLLVLVAYLIYNRLCYTQHWMTSRPVPKFGDTAAPLYANLEEWIAKALENAHSSGNGLRRWLPFLRAQRLNAREAGGIVEFVRQIDAPSTRNLWDAMCQRAPLLATPIVLAGIVIMGVAVQLATGRQLPPWAIVILVPLLALCINLSVARIDGGQSAVFEPFRRLGLEYYGDIGRVRNQPRAFVRDYPRLVSVNTERRKLSHHARTHPPGPVLYLWAVDHYIGGGLKNACYAAIIVSALGALPAYLLARHRFGNTAGLIAAGIYLLTPSLVMFGATCMDVVFAAPMIASLWLLTAATTRAADDDRPYRPIPETRAYIYAALGGVALAVSAFMSYSTICICIVFAIYVLSQILVDWRWSARSLILLSVSAAVLLACNLILYAWAGYDPIAGVRASIRADASAVDRVRAHWIDVSFANLVAFLVGLGMITTTLWLRTSALTLFEIGRSRTRRKPTYLLEAVTFITLVGLSFSRLYTLETERIWVFLMPLPIAATASWLARGCGMTRMVQVSLVLAALFAQTWLCEVFLNTWW